jgi:hypothetical protein
MVDSRPRADRILVAQLTGEARHRADSGARKLGVPKVWLIGLAGLMLILAGVSVFSL